MMKSHQIEKSPDIKQENLSDLDAAIANFLICDWKQKQIRELKTILSFFQKMTHHFLGDSPWVSKKEKKATQIDKFRQNR